MYLYFTNIELTTRVNFCPTRLFALLKIMWHVRKFDWTSYEKSINLLFVICGLIIIFCDILYPDEEVAYLLVATDTNIWNTSIDNKLQNSNAIVTNYVMHSFDFDFRSKYLFWSNEKGEIVRWVNLKNEKMSLINKP